MANVIPQNFPWHLPERAREIIASWTVKSKSPYSHSYYDQEDGAIGWDEKPIGSLRISDHWNFSSRGKTHCPTDVIPSTAEWSLAVWDGTRYTILENLGRRPIRLVTDKEARGLSAALQRNRLRAIEGYKRREEQLAGAMA
jgi:hypothetical protein